MVCGEVVATGLVVGAVGLLELLFSTLTVGRVGCSVACSVGALADGSGAVAELLVMTGSVAGEVFCMNTKPNEKMRATTRGTPRSA